MQVFLINYRSEGFPKDGNLDREGRTSNPLDSRHNVVPHSGQKNDVIVFPLSVPLLNFFGAPERRVQAWAWTKRLVLKTLPLILRQSRQWHRAYVNSEKVLLN